MAELLSLISVLGESLVSLSPVPDSSRTRNAPVAQWTERRPSKPLVTGSNPVGGATTSINRFKVAYMVGDRTLADPATAQTQTITYMGHAGMPSCDPRCPASVRARHGSGSASWSPALSPTPVEQVVCHTDRLPLDTFNEAGG